MPLPQWMQNAGQSWQDKGGVNALMSNPWFNMGQSVYQGQGAVPGYIQSQQVSQMQQQMAQQKKLQEALEALMAQKAAMKAPQPPPSIAQQMTGGLGAQAAAMPGPYQTTAPQVPQVASSPFPATQTGSVPTSAGSAPSGGPGDKYRRMLEVMAMYGDPQMQAQAASTLFGSTGQAKRKIIKDKGGFQRYVDDGSRVFPGAGGEEQSGFQGTGMEAQSINAYLASLAPEQRQAEMIRLSKERMQRPSTVATPTGTFTYPGYTMPEQQVAGAAPGATPPGFTPKPMSESEQRSRYVGTNLLNASDRLDSFVDRNPNFDPADFEHWMRDASVPKQLENFMRTGPKQAYEAMKADWAANLVFLRSGVTAREEEVEREKMKWPAPGDTEQTILEKASMRADDELNAYRQGYREGRVAPDSAQENLARLEKRAADAKAELADSGKPPWERKWKTN